jgi:uncharacterized oxidoreductase
MNLAGHTVLITGATRGIGRHLTQQAVDVGAHVVAIGRERERLAELAAAHGSSVTPLAVDLSDPDAVDAMVDQLPNTHPALSVVINNAGVQTLTDFFDEDPGAVRAVLRREISINLDAVVTISTGLLPHLRGKDQAALVNVSTGLAIAPKASAPVYCATKSAVRTFTRALRYQCHANAPTIRVTDVILPLVDTDMTLGRGSGKISPDAAAAAIMTGIRRETQEVYVGKARVLRPLMRVAPALGYRILRNG